MQRYIAAIEIGTSAIKGAVGVHDSSTDAVKVLAIEQVPVSGCMRHGWVNNVEEVRMNVERVIRALEQSGLVRPRTIEAVYLGVGGRSLTSGSRDVSLRFNEEQKITSDMVANLRRDARDSCFTSNEIIEVTPRRFTIDSGPISNPIGAYSRSIAATYTIITCRPQLVRNLQRVFAEMNPEVKIASLVVRPVAEAALVMTNDERRLGSMLVDCGAETTTIAIFKDAVLRYLATLPLGSRNITRDIATLGVTEERAEEYKISSGNAVPDGSFIPKGYSADVLAGGDANAIVAARAGEIVANIVAHINYAGLRPADLPAGIVLVGGGSQLRNFNRLLQEEAGLKVRAGYPSQAVAMADGSSRTPANTDIMAVILAAARMNQDVECLKMPAPREVPPAPAPRPAVHPAYESSQYSGPNTRRDAFAIEDNDNDDSLLKDDDDSGYDDDDDSRTTRKKKQKRGGLLNSLQMRLADLMRGPDDDDDQE